MTAEDTILARVDAGLARSVRQTRVSSWVAGAALLAVTAGLVSATVVQARGQAAASAVGAAN